MSEQLQLRRGTYSQVAAFTAQQGECVVDTTNSRLVVGDGVTTGGWPAARLAETITNTRVGVADSAYTASAADRLIAYTSITSPRIVSLPAASAYPTGTRLLVVDESGSVTATNAITLSRAGSDTIVGGTSVSIQQAYGFVGIESNGVSAWTIVDIPSGGLSGVVTVSGGGTGVSPKSVRYNVAAVGVNANSVADTSILIPLPSGITRYRVRSVTVLNASTSLTTAQAGLYTGTAGSGVGICAAQALSGITSTSAGTSGNAVDLAQALPGATFFTSTPLYFRITTAQGSAATLDVVVEIDPYT